MQVSRDVTRKTSSRWILRARRSFDSSRSVSATKGDRQRQSLDYGLIAEEVAQVDPDLAVRDRNGEVENVRYSAINATLLNEFLKEHNAFLEERKKVRKLEAALATVNQQLKEQAAKIEKVSARLELTKAMPTLVRGNP